MIVVDSNVIAYCWLNSPMTGLAQRVRVKDPDWHVPVLWRSEMRSILAGYLRDGSLSAADTRRVMRQAEEALAGFEHLVSSDAVLKVIEASPLSAYDFDNRLIFGDNLLALTALEQEFAGRCWRSRKTAYYAVLNVIRVMESRELC